MRRYLLLCSFVALFASLAGVPIFAAVAIPNRIVTAVTDSEAVAMTANVSPLMRRAVDHGRLDGALPITDLSLNFVPSAAQQASLDTLLLAQQNPASPSYHKWLTPAQFGARFGMSESDLAAVSSWLQSHGFSVEAIPPSRNAIHFAGTVAQVEQAFQTELHSITVEGEQHFANTTAPMLPSAFVGTVSAVRGLNNFRARSHAKASHTLVPYAVGSQRVKAGSSPRPFAVDPSGDEFIAPEDFANIYDVKALYGAGFSGSATYPIGIVGQTAVRTADLTDFRTAFGLSTTNLPAMVVVPGTGTSAINSTDDLGESELDLEWSGAVAPSAPIYFVYTGNSSTNGNFNYDVFDALQYAIQGYTVGGHVLPIISISYGECEPSDTTADYTVYESWFQQANAQGQTILSASGDEGAAGCDYDTTVANNYAATQGLAVDYPSSSAYVTGVGGTSFSGDVSNTPAYWSPTMDNNYGNELGLYIPSSAWNDSPSTSTATTEKGLSASGGGVSALWTKPSWQSGVAGIPTDGKRDVPDIALSADPNHDGYLVCINLGCEGNNASFNIYGGTSVSAPSFAGILAVAEQKLGAAQGNLNPSLYTVARNGTTYASAFHDVTTGSNIVPCVMNNGTTVTGDTGCAGGFLGYNAGTGYDLVTGLGAPDAANLAAALTSVATMIATSETLSYTPTAPVTGQSVTFTATVAHTTGTAAPTGTVVFTVDGATAGTSETLSSAGTAVFPGTFTTGGTHTVIATYSGDSNYIGSSATSTLTVTVAVAVTNAATTTTLTVSPASLAVGSSLTLTATVASTVSGTLAGTVTFSTTAGTIGTKALTATTNSGTSVLTAIVAIASLPVGTDTITATFGGGGTDASGGAYTASSGTATVTVTNPSIMLSATNVSVASGGTASSTVTITSGGGYAGTVNLTAASASTLSGNYTFSPISVTLIPGGSATSTFTITGVTASAAVGKGVVPLGKGIAMAVVGGGATFAGLLLFGSASIRRRRLASLLSVLLLASLAAGLGCSSSSTPAGPKTGTFTVTVTGTDASTNTITGTTTFTITVQ